MLFTLLHERWLAELHSHEMDGEGHGIWVSELIKHYDSCKSAFSNSTKVTLGSYFPNGALKSDLMFITSIQA